MNKLKRLDIKISFLIENNSFIVVLLAVISGVFILLYFVFPLNLKNQLHYAAPSPLISCPPLGHVARRENTYLN